MLGPVEPVSPPTITLFVHHLLIRSSVARYSAVEPLIASHDAIELSNWLENHRKPMVYHARAALAALCLG